MKTKILDKNTKASNPGGLTVSNKKLKVLRPDLFGLPGLIYNFKVYLCCKTTETHSIKERIYFGDSQPAIVMCLDPLLVAVYTPDIDCVVLLNFPTKLVKMYNLHLESRLISINTYGRKKDYQKDIIPGPRKTNPWTSITPTIGDFVSDDIEIINKRKGEIEEDRWRRTYDLAKEYMHIFPNVYRDGRPTYSGISAID